MVFLMVVDNPRQEVLNRLRGLRYQHFKGDTYIIVGWGTLESNKDVMVIYRKEGSKLAWIRSYSEFFESVEADGKKVDRFTLIGL
jgi:hypothetical protein